MTAVQQTSEWREVLSRGTAVALMHNFTSVSEALKELVDNAVDYRQGQQLDITIDLNKSKDQVIIEGDGGRGMGSTDIQIWLNWGSGERHIASHIGRYHQGGKAACGFLGRQVQLWAKRAGSGDVWFLQDEDWAVRQEPKSFGIPRPIAKEQYPVTMLDLPMDRGHVRIVISKLTKGRKWRLEDLKRALASTYRTLLETGFVKIAINGDPLTPLHIPLSTAVEKVDLNVRLNKGRSASGWAGRLNRNDLPVPLKSGVRLVYNGRLVKEGEWFGYNFEGKGALNSLIGELEMKGFTPVPNKTDFVDRSEAAWDILSKAILDQLRPLITQLSRSGEEARVTRQEKRTVSQVAEELKQVLDSLKDNPYPSSSEQPDGKRSPSTGPADRKHPQPTQFPLLNPQPPRPNPSPRQPRTPPPDDPVGTLIRLLERITDGDTRPPLRIRAWDSSVRSAWTQEGGQTWLDINKNYPLYRQLNGASPYLAETAILQLAQPPDGETMDASSYVDKVNLMLLRWSQIADTSDHGSNAALLEAS